MVDSKMALPEHLQDFSKPMEIIGCDVEALYPSLDIDVVCDTVYQEILDTEVTWGDIDYLEGCRYIALNWDRAQCRNSGLRRVLPVRRSKNGTRPGVAGPGPMGLEIHDQEQWVFPAVVLTEEEKRLIIATVVKIACRTLFKNHLYEFGGKIFKQREGGPIGLRATCAVARLVMCIWDRLWKNRLEHLGIRTELEVRYMDDGRVAMHPIRNGWRWTDEGLQFCQAWATEDLDLSPTEVTSRIMLGTMNGVVKGINFTVETRLDFDGHWLPTLDIKLAVTPTNRIKFKYYEKEVATNTVLHKKTAMEENQKAQILAQEMVRRMLNTNDMVDKKTRLEVVDNMAKKMRTSGYSVKQTRKIISNGLINYEAKKTRCRVEGKPLYRTAKTSIANRYKKNW